MCKPYVGDVRGGHTLVPLLRVMMVSDFKVVDIFRQCFVLPMVNVGLDQSTRYFRAGSEERDGGSENRLHVERSP